MFYLPKQEDSKQNRLDRGFLKKKQKSNCVAKGAKKGSSLTKETIKETLLKPNCESPNKKQLEIIAFICLIKAVLHII